LRWSFDPGTLARMTGDAVQAALPPLAIVLRLLLAFACGAAIGLNREFHRKPAGFRTFGLVSIGSALLVIVMQNGHGGPDAQSRVIQGIVTGIGFLGAGVIFRRESPTKVSGLTTAAAVWLTAGLGVAAGLGQYVVAIAGAVLSLLLLLLGGPFERLITGRGKKNGAEPGNDPEDAP
jgi:putative Mg2+ transporter-C (MgtC) family protein